VYKRQGPLKSLYYVALADEQENLRSQKIYKLVKLPPGKKPIRNRCVFDVVFDGTTGLLQKVKARIVAQGFSQVPGVDFDPFSTYASTPKLSTARYWLYTCVQLGFKMEEWDIKAAYLHADLDEHVLMIPPAGLEQYDSDGNRLVWQLQKSLYGLKQSGHNWMKKIFSFLEQYGFEQSMSDTSLWFLRADKQLTMILFIHTDDGKIGFADKVKVRDPFMKALCSKFNVGSQQSHIDRIFNIKIEHRPDGGVSLHQTKSILTLCKNYNVTPDCKTTSPMSSTWSLALNDTVSTEHQNEMRTVPYLGLLASMMWIARCTRWDILCPLIILSRVSCNPAPRHWKALLKVLQYLANTADWQLVYSPDKSSYQHMLRVYADASHASDPDTLRSISGHIVMLGTAVLDWISQHQAQIALHSGEAETIAVSSAATHVLYWQQLITQIESVKPKTIIFVDATTAQNVLSDPVHRSRMKHLNTRLLFTREHYKAGDFTFKHISGDKNPADALTKAVSAERLQTYLQTLLPQGGGETETGTTIFEIAEAKSTKRPADDRDNESDKRTKKAKDMKAADVLNQKLKDKKNKKKGAAGTQRS